MRYFLHIVLVLYSSLAIAETKTAIDKFVDDQFVPSDTEMASDAVRGTLIKYFEHKDGVVSVLWTYSEANYYENRLYLIEVSGNTYQILEQLRLSGNWGSSKIGDVKFEGEKLKVTALNYSSSSIARCCPDIKVTKTVLVHNRQYLIL